MKYWESIASTQPATKKTVTVTDSALNFSKVFFLRTYISIYKFNVICISETFINSDTAFDDDNLKIEGHNIVRSNHSLTLDQVVSVQTINSH